MQSNIKEQEGILISKFSLVLPLFIYFLVYALFFIPISPSIISYSIVYISSSLVFIFLCRYILKTELASKTIYILIVIAIVLRIVFLFIAPTGSDDYYRYIWDGKVIANGINPYEYAPDDSALSNLHSEDLPGNISFAHIKTIYPPLSLDLFYAAYIIGGESFLGIKMLLLLFEVFTIAGIYLILREKESPLKNILIYTLAPLPLFQFFIDAHVDGFGLPLLIFSIYFYLKDKKILSLILLALSISIKPVGLILLPILFLTGKGMRAKIQTILIPVLVCAILYLPFVFSTPLSRIFEALTNFTVNWTFNGFVFEIFNSLLNDNQKSRSLCGIIFILVYLPVIFSRKDFLNKIYLSVFLLLIFSPVAHPWYVTWLAVLLPIISRWSGILYMNLICLTVFTVLNYQLYGIWKNYPAVLILEYVPVLTFFLYELIFKKYNHIYSNHN
jgi:alpha-1,6-mannosyltransferase